jgi:hypothetical protein
MKVRGLVFHPWFVLSSAIIFATAYAIWIAVRHHGPGKLEPLYYLVPITVPFVAFLFDRAESPSRLTIVALAIDVLVIGIALARSAGHVPFVSGHALFVTYALLSTRSRVARVSAAIVMIQVLFLKLFLWHDVVSLAGGIVLGSVTAGVSRWYVAKISESRLRRVSALASN